MTLSLYDDVSTLPGVGEKRQQALRELGIQTIESLLTYYPYRYEDLGSRLPSETLDGERVTFKGTLVTPPTLAHFGYKKSRLTFRMVLADNQVISVNFFNQPRLKHSINEGDELAVFGTYDRARQSLAGQKIIKKQSEELAPIYPVSKAIRQQTLKDLIEVAYGRYHDLIVDVMPTSLQDKYQLLSRQQVIEWMHFPHDLEEVQQANRSAAFEEFFLFQMRLQIIRLADQRFSGQAIDYDHAAVQKYEQALPYQLTTAQQKVLAEILGDLNRPLHMNRLLQGDVGSGKTVVAALAMYAVVTSGRQAALMAPTEILAQQHGQNLAKLFADEAPEVRVELLTSGLKAKARRDILKDLADGEINIIVGTHALIQSDVQFHHLGLAVIDEQHRFGVQQRATLREQGQNPDILAMTATPIPRTLSITAYGEMSVSTIDQLPNGRQPITTRWVKGAQYDDVMQWVKQELAQGAQVYVVAPLIEESDTLDVQNATRIYEDLNETLGQDNIHVGLLHGRMSNEEKQTVMNEFKANQIQVLVATTVIEVGVDVPNATIMVVLDADRFGLAQLHQLRGRVGRGAKKSYTILIADPKTEYGRARLETMVETNDGFVLAQKDLELRGPGDVLGNKQSGVPEFKVGDPVKDLAMMEIAQQEATQLVDTPQWDDDKTNAGLVNYLSATMADYRNFD